MLGLSAPSQTNTTGSGISAEVSDDSDLFIEASCAGSPSVRLTLVMHLYPLGMRNLYGSPFTFSLSLQANWTRHWRASKGA